MEKLNLLSDQATFMEFGCGAGELSKFIHEATQSSNSDYVIIDRKRVKLKCGYELKNSNQFEQIIMDIKDIDLNLLLNQHLAQPYVAYSKHLCGSATDLSLRCIINQRNRDNEKRNMSRGIAFALCCHGLCSP